MNESNESNGWTNNGREVTDEEVRAAMLHTIGFYTAFTQGGSTYYGYITACDGDFMIMTLTRDNESTPRYIACVMTDFIGCIDFNAQTVQIALVAPIYTNTALMQ